MISSEEFYSHLKRVRALKEEKSRMKEQEKEINKAIAEMSDDIIEYFETHDIPRQEIDGSLFYVARTPCYSINNEDAFFNWMREEGDLDLCMSFNAKKFGAYYKEKVEGNEELPPGVGVYIKTAVKVKKGD